MTMSVSNFEDFKKKFSLLIDFDKFAQSVIDLLNMAVKTPDGCKASLEIGEDIASLAFLRILKLRSVEVLKLEFVQSDPEFTRKKAQGRFQKVQADYQHIDTEFQEQMRCLKSLSSPVATKIEHQLDQAGLLV